MIHSGPDDGCCVAAEDVDCSDDDVAAGAAAAVDELNAVAKVADAGGDGHADDGYCGQGHVINVSRNVEKLKHKGPSMNSSFLSTINIVSDC